MFLEARRFNSRLVHSITLLCYKFRILSVTVELSQPFDLSVSALLCCLLLTQLRLEMELLRLLIRLEFHSIARCQNFVRYGAPTVTLDPLIPAVMVIVIGLVILYVDLFLSNFFLNLIVVSWSESVDINDATVGENLVIDERGEPFSTESESDMTS